MSFDPYRPKNMDEFKKAIGIWLDEKELPDTTLVTKIIGSGFRFLRHLDYKAFVCCLNWHVSEAFYEARGGKELGT